MKDMETRKQIAAEKKRCNSHNCAQAILHTYADIAGISEDEAMNIAGAFGGGMGNMEGPVFLNETPKSLSDNLHKQLLLV